MSGGIRSDGDPGFTTVMNWRLDEDLLDVYEFKIAIWLASHAPHYCEAYVTRNEIAKRAHISGPKVSAALDRLVKLGIISVETVGGAPGRPRWVITFHYGVWHGTKGREPPFKGSVAPFEADHTSLIRKDKGKEDARAALVVLDDDFDTFWGAYPRKTDKIPARKAWAKAIKTTPVADVLMGASIWVLAWERDRTEERFIPLAATWLNKRRWESKPPAPVRPQTRQAEKEDYLGKLRALANGDAPNALERGGG